MDNGSGTDDSILVGTWITVWIQDYFAIVLISDIGGVGPRWRYALSSTFCQFTKGTHGEYQKTKNAFSVVGTNTFVGHTS